MVHSKGNDTIIIEIQIAVSHAALIINCDLPNSLMKMFIYLVSQLIMQHLRLSQEVLSVIYCYISFNSHLQYCAINHN